MSDPTMTISTDPRAPMAAAPLKYLPDGSVDWGNMWDTFCVLAIEGGPPHRGTLLDTTTDDPHFPEYHAVTAEIVRGIKLVSGLDAAAAEPGWLAVICDTPGMARWLAEAVLAENVAARAAGVNLLVPVASYYTLKLEIKNVVTAVAKTTHYWDEHLANDIKRVLAFEDAASALRARAARLLRMSR